MEALGSLARLTLDIAPATPHTVVQEGTRLTVRFEADMLDAALPATTSPDLVVNVRPGDGTGVDRHRSRATIRVVPDHRYARRSRHRRGW